MENATNRFNISSISNVAPYFLAAVVVTGTVYKIIEYVFPKNAESKLNFLMAVVGFSSVFLAIRVITPQYFLHQLAIPVFVYAGGAIAVAVGVFVFWMYSTPSLPEVNEVSKTDKPQLVSAIKPKSTPGHLFTEEEYQNFVKIIGTHVYLLVQGPSGSPYKDVIEFYLSKNPGSVFQLQSSLDTEEDIISFFEEMRCKTTPKKILWMDASDRFVIHSDMLGSFRDQLSQIKGFSCVYTASYDKENEPKSEYQVPTLRIQPASKEATQKMLEEIYLIDKDDAQVVVSFADFLSPALPGSVTKLYLDWKGSQPLLTFLDYLALQFNVDAVFLRPTNKKEVEKCIEQAKVGMNKDLVALQPVFHRICDRVLIGLHLEASSSKKTPLASFLISGVTGSGKTAIAETAARHLFRNNLIRVDLSLLLAENVDAFKTLQDFLIRRPFSVVLFEGVDRLYGHIDSMRTLIAPAIMNTLIAILRGELKDVSLNHAIVFFTAEEHDMLDETFKSLTTSLPLEYGNAEFDLIFKHYFDKTRDSCPSSSSNPLHDLESLKKSCPVFEGNVRELQNFLNEELLLPALKSLPSSANMNLRSTAVTKGLSLSKKADSFVTRLLPSPYEQMHGLFRDAQYQQFIRALRQQKGAILVGPSGSGKSDMIQRLMKDSNLGYREVIRLNTTSFAADTKWLGQFESHVKELKERISKNKSLLVIEGPALLLNNRADESDYYNFIDHLEKALEGEDFRVVITLSKEEYTRLEDRSSKLMSRLAKIVLDPLDVPTSKKLLLQIQTELQKKLNCTFDEKAFDTVLRYSHYLKGSLPGSAILFLQGMPAQENDKVDEEKILSNLSLQLNIGLPWLQFAHPDLETTIADAKLSLKKQIHGQDKPINDICDLIEVRHMKLSSSPTATLGNFLVMGEPGVGKTYFAQLLSKELFQSNFIRIDMQHLIDPNELIKLTAHGGSLSKLNDHPFSVVLLDEIEKAPKEAQDALLGILQDGKFIDKKGYEVRFDHAVIIMTTNASQESLNHYFTTAFVSRTTPIAFNTLSQEALSSIIKDKLEVIKKSCEKYQTNIEFDESVVQHLVKQFLSEKRNARDADRFLEEKVSLPLIKVLKSHQKLTAKIDQNNIIFELAQ